MTICDQRSYGEGCDNVELSTMLAVDGAAHGDGRGSKILTVVMFLLLPQLIMMRSSSRRRR